MEEFVSLLVPGWVVDAEDEGVCSRCVGWDLYCEKISLEVIVQGMYKASY